MGETDNRERLHEILDIVLDCNGTGKRIAGKTGTMPTAFFSFSGHVAMLTVDIYPDGYETNWFNKTFRMYTDRPIEQSIVNDIRECAEDALENKNTRAVLEHELAAADRKLEEHKAYIKDLQRRLKELDS